MNKRKSPYYVCEHLPKNITSEMKNQTIQSKKDGLEHGFTICSSTKYLEDMSDKNTVALGKCIGTECKISVTKEEVKKSCPSDKKDLAYFHTHPHRDISLPSFDDIISMRTLEHKFSCIGSKAEIRCFSHNIPTSRAFMSVPSQEYDRFKKQWELHAEDCIIDIK